MLEIKIIPYGVIYKLTNKLNNKIYVGKTKNFLRRMNEYKTRKVSDSPKYNYGIMREINKVGFNNFSVEILDVCFSEVQLAEREKYHILNLRANDPNIGYNSRAGDLKEPLNYKTRQIMSLSHIGLTEAAETKRKKSKPIIAFKDNICYIAESGKLFGDYIHADRAVVSHGITRIITVQGYYIFRYDDLDYTDKYINHHNQRFYELYKLVKKGVETIEKSYNIIYLNYD